MAHIDLWGPDLVRIVIVHFHLQTGGVTRVIAHSSRVLQASGHRVLVLTGEAPESPLPEGVAWSVIPGLAYEERRQKLDAEALGRTLEKAARDHFGRPPHLWHVHNHALGKNLALPGALRSLAEAGHRLVLQLHDFAEDGRPALYARLSLHARLLSEVGQGDPVRLSDLLYPQAPQIHYAVLNGRDRRFLAAASTPEERLHRLPNAVSLERTPGSEAAHPFGTDRLWLYPTRSIRRKNLGEFLLWAALAEPGDRFAATQAPQNPSERPRYLRWRHLAETLSLPVEFEVGNRVRDFSGLLASAQALVTTSVAEGFGLAFLEPWLLGRPLVGRDLPEITEDFTAAGIDLGGLYDHLWVPLDWIDGGRLRQALETALTQVMAAYGRQATPEQVEALWEDIQVDGAVDFGRLDEVAQEEVIRHLVQDPEARRQLRPQALAFSESQVNRNRAIVEREYSLARYGQRLEALYAAVLASPVGAVEGGDAPALLAEFLDPKRLVLLRT